MGIDQNSRLCYYMFVAGIGSDDFNRSSFLRFTMTPKQITVEVLGRVAYTALGFIIAVILFSHGVI